jgi:hypothetical protein
VIYTRCFRVNGFCIPLCHLLQEKAIQMGRQFKCVSLLFNFHLYFFFYIFMFNKTKIKDKSLQQSTVKAWWSSDTVTVFVHKNMQWESWQFCCVTECLTKESWLMSRQCEEKKAGTQKVVSNFVCSCESLFATTTNMLLHSKNILVSGTGIRIVAY